MSEISGRGDCIGRAGGDPAGPAFDRLTGTGKHEHAGSQGDHGGDEENGSETALLDLAGRVKRGQHKDEAGDKQKDSGCEVPEGEGRKRFHPPEVAEVGHGVVSAAVAASAIAGCVILFPAERALVQALVLLAAYPCFGALFYVGYRRWGRWLGAPAQLGPACFAMALASWFLMVSGDPAAQRVAFWFAQTGLVLSGISIGCGLAMIAAALDTDWRGAVRAALEADRAATRRLQAGDAGR